MTNRPDPPSLHLVKDPVPEKPGESYRERVLQLYHEWDKSVGISKYVDQHVKMHLNEHNIQIDLRGGGFVRHGESLGPEKLGAHIWREWDTIQVSHFRMACSDIVIKLREKVTRHIKGKLFETPENSPSPLGELHKWLDLVLPDGLRTSDADLYAYYETAMRQLIWQVKRRLRGERTWWEIMPVLISAQGTGKSSAVEKLGTPLDILFMPDADFRLFEDPFRIQQLGYSYLIRLDEMGKASKADMETVKRTITQRVAQARGMRSEVDRVVVRNASFIGTANQPLHQLFHDATGMRRFVEIRCRDDRYTEAWGKAIRAIDYNALWRAESGLDERSPYQANEELMRRYQQRLHFESEFETWRKENLVETKGHRLPNHSVRKAYVDHCAELRIKPLPSSSFTGLMREYYREVKPGNRQHWCDVAIRSSPE